MKRRGAGRPARAGAPAGRGARPAPAGPPARRAIPPAPPVPLRHPAMIAAALAAAVSVAVSVTFLVFDPDLWQHLAVGRAIWSLHAVPVTNLWTWPAYGAPDVNPSWGFRALLWPFWAAGEAWGLQAWRWLVTLATFALAWLAARRMGARGFAPLVAIAVAALVYRQRSYPRPENLSALLLALEVLVLETRRRGPRELAWALPPLAVLWVNVHVGWWMLFAVAGAYLAHDLAVARWPALARGALAGADRAMLARRPAALAAALVAAGGAALVNPFGAGALWAPFDYWLNQRHEAIYRGLAELQPVLWSANLANGLPVLLAGWVLLALGRALRRRGDVAELALLALFTPLALSSQRFLGPWAVLAAVFAGRGLHGLLRATPRPAALARPWPRAAVAAALALGLGVPEWRRPEIPLGVGIAWHRYPVGAADYLEANGVRGRLFNNYSIGGWLLWRFWPDRERLPFIDIHQSGGPALRAAYVEALAGPAGWRALDDRHRFDAVVLNRPPRGVRGPLDVIGADSAFATVFVDDAGAVLVRRARFPALAARDAYRVLPPGGAALGRLRRAAIADSALRAAARAELERCAAASPANAVASEMLGLFDALEGRHDDARRRLRHALAVDPLALGVHESLGLLALVEGHGDEALREFEAERRLRTAPGGIDLRIGQAHQRRGDLARAVEAYRREVARGPHRAEAAESLRVVLARIGRSPRAGRGPTARRRRAGGVARGPLRRSESPCRAAAPGRGAPRRARVGPGARSPGSPAARRVGGALPQRSPARAVLAAASLTRARRGP
uniref:Tetratricopeptide repeat protein n=1 Tax=Eiseniibacteriota bacterium TaxID=2212470 RepID=A0A832I2T2_UNCEI